ncbi:MAG TPA: hypothetical protein VG733_03755 [Chthoniobacteraceae bacterium]|nr:hypothetical protein [Chthoniobacteraceae bacterium]
MNTNTSSSNPEARDLLKRRHRWTRLGWPLTIANLGLLATLILLLRANPALAQVQAWGNLPAWWAAGAGASLFVALVFLAARRRTITHSARHLDATLDARNRLETTAILGGADDPLARAQRDETTEFLRSHPAPTHHWGLRALSVALCVFVVAHLFLLTAWTRPWQVAAQPAPKPTPPAVPPKATIVWKKPSAETSAAPIEEVPLTAEANSESGLHDMTLELSVNGEHKLSVKVPVDALDKAGKHPIAVSMYLDQLNVEPYDMVSYYLSAQRISPDKLAATTSPVQFVEVKPFREDIGKMPGGGGGGGAKEKAAESIGALKLAQLRLMKENFLLAHTDLTHDDADWLKEDQRVGSEQGVLETKTSGISQQLTDAGAPAEIIDLLTQAQPLMTDASTKITAKDNEPALTPQGKSLALITSIEKYIRKVIADSKSQAQAQPKPKDPFEKRKDLDMKPRSTTPAGQLEQIAKDQEQLAHDMAQQQQQQAQDSGQQSQQNSAQQAQNPGQQANPGQQGQNPGQQGQNPGQQAQQNPGQQGQNPGQNPGQQGNPNQSQGTTAERQAQINQRISDLMKGQQFDPGVNEHLQKGSEQAGESLKQLNAGDPKQAQEAAAESASELHKAADAMNQAGEQKANDQVADAIKMLDEAAAQASTAPQQKTDADAKGAAQKAQDDVTQAKAGLAQAAQDQQATGSEQAATRLAQFANMLNDKGLRDDMQQLHDKPRDTAQAANVAGKLNDIANQLASTPGGAPKTPDEIAKLIDRMERSKANLDHLAQMQQQQGNDGKGQGQNPGPSPTNNPGGANPGQGKQQQQAFAKQVLEDVLQEAAEARPLLPPQATQALREAVGPSQYGGKGGNVVKSFGKIQGPLDSMLSLLRDKLLDAQRNHDLADQSDTPAPPAYRDAVADYFEQLSRDYGKSPAPAPDATPKPQ